MPGIHKNTTISFRPSEWEKRLIEERAELCGISKKDFIVRSCIYGSVVVTGQRENIDRIVAAVQEMEAVLIEIAGMLIEHPGDLSLQPDSVQDIRESFLAAVIVITEILDGAAYLFHKKPKLKKRDWKNEKEIRQYEELLKMELRNNSNIV